MSNSEIIQPNPVAAKRVLASYLWGFVLAVLLVLISYFSVTQGWIKTLEAGYLLFGLLLVLQVLIHMFSFFQLSLSSAEDKLHFWVFIFTAVIMLIVISGSLWIMYNLNYYMVN